MAPVAPFAPTARMSGTTADERLEAALREAGASKGEPTVPGGGRGRLPLRSPTDMPGSAGPAQGGKTHSASRGAGRSVPVEKVVPTYHMPVGDTSSEDQSTEKGARRVTSASAHRGASAHDKSGKLTRPSFLEEEELAALAGVTKRVTAKWAEQRAARPSADSGAGVFASAASGAGAGTWTGAFQGAGEKLSAASGAEPPIVSTRRSQRSPERDVGSKSSPQRQRTRSRGSEASDTGYNTGRSNSRRTSKSVSRAGATSMPAVSPRMSRKSEPSAATQDDIMMYVRRIEELEEREQMLNEANVHLAQKASEAEQKAKTFEDQGKELYSNPRAVLKESDARLTRLRELERSYENSQRDLASMEERRRTTEAEVAAFHARAEKETYAICMEGERKFAAKLKEKDDLLAGSEQRCAAKAKGF